MGRASVTGLVRDAATVADRRVGNDAIAEREVIGSADGCAPFSLRVLRCVRGRSFERLAESDEELLFVLTGHGTLLAEGHAHALAPQIGVRLAPGTRYELDNERLELDGSGARRFLHGGQVRLERSDGVTATSRRTVLVTHARALIGYGSVAQQHDVAVLEPVHVFAAAGEGNGQAAENG